MPIYEYTCRQCGEDFEELVRNAAHEKELTCTACDSAQIERRLSVPAAPQSSGSAAPACDTGLPIGCGQCATNPACPYQG